MARSYVGPVGQLEAPLTYPELVRTGLYMKRDGSDPLDQHRQEVGLERARDFDRDRIPLLDGES